MNKISTLEEILLFTYGEADETQKENIIHEIESKNSFLKEYTRLKNTKKIMDDSMVNPPDVLVKSIMDYSKALAVMDMKVPGLNMMIQN